MSNVPTSATIKVVVTGPVGSVIRTFVEALSDMSVSSSPSDALVRPGRSAPVPVDFGRARLSDDLTFHLFGTSEPAALESVWPIVEDGLLGAVVLVDTVEPDWLTSTRRRIRELETLGTSSWIVGAIAPSDVGAIRRDLGLEPTKVSVDTDPFEKGSCRATVLALLRASISMPTIVFGASG